MRKSKIKKEKKEEKKKKTLWAIELKIVQLQRGAKSKRTRRALAH